MHGVPELLLRVPRREEDARRHLGVEGDLEGVRPGAGEWDVEHEYGSRLDVHDSSGWLAELYRTLAAQELISSLVHESDTDRVYPDLRASSADAQHEVRPRTDRRETGEPDVLEDAENAELTLLIDEGVVGDECEVEMQGQATRIEVMTSFCLMLLTTSIPCRICPNTVCTRSRWACGL
jgi:hypothetical protein